MPDVIVLVGSEPLMGRELRELLESNSMGAGLRLVSGSGEGTGVLSEQKGELTLISKLDGNVLDDADAIILAGDPVAAARAVDLKPKATLIDLTHATEERPQSRLRAPMVEPYDFHAPPDAIQSIAHPAAIALAIIHGQLTNEHEIAQWVVQVFEPASERGTPGVEELQQQTLSLLSFKPMPKKVFDQQLAFTMLGRVGEEAAVQLETVESRIERHLATLLHNGGGGPMPSLRVVQAPVFHGYSLSIWVEFAGAAPDQKALEALLGGDLVDVRGHDLEPPNNVGIAGQEGVSAGAIHKDHNNPQAAWIWAVADNLRLAARNALLVAREVL